VPRAPLSYQCPICFNWKVVPTLARQCAALHALEDPEEVAVAAGTGMPPQWLHYWLAGEGAAKFGGWGHPGDYDGCLAAIQAKVIEHHGKPLADHVIHGLCATLHKMATGAPPGKAPAERALHAAVIKH
jgi:hypothetical protein